MTRSLKIEECGDFSRIRSGREAAKAKIRLSGNWLVRAGFPAGSRVEVVTIEQGHIELRVRRVEV